MNKMQFLAVCTLNLALTVASATPVLNRIVSVGYPYTPVMASCGLKGGRVRRGGK